MRSRTIIMRPEEKARPPPRAKSPPFRKIPPSSPMGWPTRHPPEPGTCSQGRFSLYWRAYLRNLLLRCRSIVSLFPRWLRNAHEPSTAEALLLYYVRFVCVCVSGGESTLRRPRQWAGIFRGKVSAGKFPGVFEDAFPVFISNLFICFALCSRWRSLNAHLLAIMPRDMTFVGNGIFFRGS